MSYCHLEWTIEEKNGKKEGCITKVVAIIKTHLQKYSIKGKYIFKYSKKNIYFLQK